VDLDELPGHLISEGTGDGLQFRELGAPGEPLGVKLVSQFPSHLTQAVMEFVPNGGGVLAHLRSPQQVEGRGVEDLRASIGRLTSAASVVQTMSCARIGLTPAIRVDACRSPRYRPAGSLLGGLAG